MLKGKKAIITGGAQGIGKTIAQTFLAQGADVCIIDLKESPFMEELEQSSKDGGGNVCVKLADVSKEEAITPVIEEALKEAGNIDVLVNNAGITRDGLSFRMPAADWDLVLKVNLYSAFYASKPVANKMIRQRSGSIINIASVVGIVGNAGQINYSSSKAGLIGFTKSLAREVATRGVRVNALAPGFIRTAMTDAMPDKAKEATLSQIPLGKMGEAEDVAKAALFLASDLSEYITGEIIRVAGGMAM